jgi:tRNA (cytidine/uridine-2'-O-)-methyltransferase
VINIVLYQPEIPPNTGNVIRLCANTGAHLHLVRPLGFGLDAPRLRRAGLDYADLASVAVWDSLEECLVGLRRPRTYAVSTRGTVRYDHVRYFAGDALIFGPETQGLPDTVLAAIAPERVIRLPMQPANRSLNLSNAVAIVTYEAWRQSGFAGAAP